MNICWFNFHLQPNTNVETTLGHRHGIGIILSMLLQHCFANLETTSINIRLLNFHFQPNINVETTSMNVDDQLCFNVDSTLMCLLGIFWNFIFHMSYMWFGFSSNKTPRNFIDSARAVSQLPYSRKLMRQKIDNHEIKTKEIKANAYDNLWKRI